MPIPQFAFAILVPSGLSNLDPDTFQPRLLLAEALAPWVKVRLLAKYGSSLTLSLSRIVTPWDRTMGDNAVVPESHATRLPLPAHRQVICGMKMLAKKIQGVDCLLSLQLREMDDEGRIVEERFYSGDRMRAYLQYVRWSTSTRYTMHPTYQWVLTADWAAKRGNTPIHRVQETSLDVLQHLCSQICLLYIASSDSPQSYERHATSRKASEKMGSTCRTTPFGR